ncbi:MAG: YjbQ family protein [Olsenella profusa]
MIVHHARIDLHTVSGRPSYHNITENVRGIVAESTVRNGICTIASAHTTCSVYFDEFMHDRNYYGDEYLHVDLDQMLDRIAPRQTTENQYHSPGPKHIAYGMTKKDPDYPAQAWTMLNTDGHLRSDLFGASETFPIKDKELLIGAVGSIYFVDFDQTRERNRHCNIVIIGTED